MGQRRTAIAALNTGGLRGRSGGSGGEVSRESPRDQQRDLRAGRLGAESARAVQLHLGLGTVFGSRAGFDRAGPPNRVTQHDGPPTDPKLPNGIIEFTRSVYDAATGGSPAQPRQQLNLITSFVDASNVYGSDDNRANALRANDGTGRLRSFVKDVGELLPKNLYGFHDATIPPLPATAFFLAGDVRANEHSVLTSLHTVFVREHNRLCGEIAKKEPQSKGDDEVIYQRARRIVGALMQAVAYNEFLPALLGAGAITPYPGSLLSG